MIGMLMDAVSGVLLASPLLFLIAVELGVDPIQFTAIVGVNLGMGNITPPNCACLYQPLSLFSAKVYPVFSSGFFYTRTIVIKTNADY